MEKNIKRYHEKYPNGRLLKTGNLVNGVRCGLWKSWYQNGQLKSKENYVNGKRHGPLKEYYVNGQCETKENYANGQLHGFRESYNEGGKLWLKQSYTDGEFYGLVEVQDFSGEPDTKYQADNNYKDHVRLVLNQVVQIKDLSKQVSDFLQNIPSKNIKHEKIMDICHVLQFIGFLLGIDLGIRPTK